MWVVQLEEEKWRRPFKIFFPAFRWKMTHDFHFSKPSSWEKNQEKWHLIPFSEDVAILLIFPCRKIDNTHTFLAPIFKNSKLFDHHKKANAWKWNFFRRGQFFVNVTWHFWELKSNVFFFTSSFGDIDLRAPKAMFFGWCTRSIFFLLPAKLDCVSWLKGAICDDAQDGTWVVAWPPTFSASFKSN